MDRKTAIIAIVVFVLALAAAGLLVLGQSQEPEGYRGADVKGPSIRVASWNLQEFGPSKAGNTTLLFAYADKIQDYDIVFLQEIKDSTNESFPLLCSLLIGYDCVNSSRAGRTSSKEQYGVIYRKGMNLTSWRDYNPDPLNRWERPPFEATFDLGTHNITFLVMHAKPADVQNELARLEEVVPREGDVAVIGDLNADCDYYDPSRKASFTDWSWAIPDGEDTSVSNNTHCAYDRILLNDGAKQRFQEYGIDRNVTRDMSDHYLIWIRID